MVVLADLERKNLFVHQPCHKFIYFLSSHDSEKQITFPLLLRGNISLVILYITLKYFQLLCCCFFSFL